jgi:hypothetical protein
MQAKQIRIGNIIQWDEEPNDVVEVTSIFLEPEMDNSKHYSIDFIDPSGNKENDGTAFLDAFTEIPLTEEWLLKFGLLQCRENSLGRAYAFFPDGVRYDDTMIVYWITTGVFYRKNM